MASSSTTPCAFKWDKTTHLEGLMKSWTILGLCSVYNHFLPVSMCIVHYILVNTDQAAMHNLTFDNTHEYAVWHMTALDFQFGSFTLSLLQLFAFTSWFGIQLLKGSRYITHVAEQHEERTCGRLNVAACATHPLVWGHTNRKLRPITRKHNSCCQA